MLFRSKAAKMFRADLADARASWIGDAATPHETRRRTESDFLAYRDASGQLADFHALRHTYITSLARGGVHPKIAQQLARHSTITLTMDRYSHTVLGELSDALSALPELSAGDSQLERQRATGTCGDRPIGLPTGLPNSLPKRGSLKNRSVRWSALSGRVSRYRHLLKTPRK